MVMCVAVIIIYHCAFECLRAVPRSPRRETRETYNNASQQRNEQEIYQIYVRRTVLPDRSSLARQSPSYTRLLRSAFLPDLGSYTLLTFPRNRVPGPDRAWSRKNPSYVFPLPSISRKRLTLPADADERKEIRTRRAEDA